MTRLDGRVAVITGGARGIGRETALLFAGAGAAVDIWDLTDDAGQAVVGEIATGRAAYRHVDVTDAAAVAAAVEASVAQWGRVDILINNAGILRDAQLVKMQDADVVGRMSEASFDAVISVNLKGTFLCGQAVAPVMIRNMYGRILNASSVVGLYGNFGQSNYVATKSGVIGLTKVWARELGPKGITVNAVAPGFIGTEMVRSMPEGILQGMVARTPVRRLGEPRDVANAYLFLASDEASFINGAVLSVDGGVVVGT